MPAGSSFNGGFSSNICKELEIEPKSFMLPSEALLQEKLVNGDFLPQWGHHKRPRLVKGATENLSNNTTTKITGSRVLSMRWHSVDQGIRLPLQACPASEYTKGMGEVSSDPIQGANDVIEAGSKIALSLHKNSESLPHEKPCNWHNSSNAGRTTTDSNSHGRAESKSSRDRPAISGKSSSGLPRWPKISLSLSRKEKQEDFLAMKGTKLPQRPKRRSKQAEKVLQYVIPGGWLPHLTQDRYEVREKQPVKKGPRGLKEMDSFGSGSDSE